MGILTNDFQKDFNPHPRTEGDGSNLLVVRKSYHFNPHPRTEGDKASFCLG